MTDDERAALLDRQTFLLRSIDDLDAELVAGDLSPADHAALRDDYVARAAACTRALEDNTTVVEGRPAALAERRRTPLVIAACVSLAAIAGVLLSSTLGARTPGAPATGSIPAGTSERLGLAGRLAGQGKALEAVKIYDRVLKDEPRNPAALAYRGWVIRLAGLKDEGLTYVDKAVAADPGYPDAHFFRGMMLWQDKHDPVGGVAEFRLFLANRPPQQMVPVVEQALREAAAEAGIPAQ